MFVREKKFKIYSFLFMKKIFSIKMLQYKTLTVQSLLFNRLCREMRF